MDIDNKITIPTVNDPTTGGVDKIASAEAVKKLKSEVDAKATDISITGNKVQLKKSDGTFIGSSIVLPSGGGTTLSDEQITNINKIPDILSRLDKLENECCGSGGEDDVNINKDGLFIWLDGSDNSSNTVWKDKSGKGNDFNLVNVTSSNWGDKFFNNKGTAYGSRSNGQFKNLTANITVTAKLNLNSSKKWCDLLSFGGLNYFKFTQTDTVGFNIYAPANPAWGGNPPAKLTVGKDAEITISLTSGKCFMYINGSKVGESVYPTATGSYLYSDIAYLFCRTLGDSILDCKLYYLMVYNRTLSADEINKNFVAYNPNGIAPDPDIPPDPGPDPTPTPDPNDDYYAGYFDDEPITSFTAANPYYLSPNGNDSNNGTARTTPLKTLAGYKAKINAANISESTLYVEDGEYILTSDFNLYDGKFGNSTKVNIQGIANKAEFTTADTLNNGSFISTSMNGTTVYKYDLSSLGINFSIQMSGSTSNIWEAPFILCDGNRMMLASYPKGDMWTTSEENAAVASGSGFYITARSGTDRSRLNGISNWANVILDNFSGTPYSNYMVNVTSYNSSNGRIQTASRNPDWGAQGYSGGIMYRLINVKDEVKNAGEYYIDYSNKLLYFIPPTGKTISNCKIQIVQRKINNNGAAFYSGNSASDSYGYRNNINVNFNKISFSGYRAPIFSGALSGVTFTKCLFRNTTADGITSSNSKNIKFDTCRFENNSGKAISIASPESGAMRRKLVGCNVVVNNCVFVNGGYLHYYMGYQFAVELATTGMTVNNCRFKHHPGIVIRFQQNNNVIQNSKFKDSCYILSDTGCIYTGRDVVARGNTISGNLIFDINSYNMRSNARSGIYLDDMASGTIIKNNHVIGYAMGLQLGGGSCNEITKNIFESCKTPIYGDARGTTWMKLGQIYAPLSSVYPEYTNSQWKSAYPGIEYLPQNSSQYNYNNSTSNPYAIPRLNVVTNNSYKNCSSGDQINNLIKQYGTVQNNG